MQGRSLLSLEAELAMIGAGFSPDQESIIRNRLSGLGYI
jgi:hypothetical protein